MRHSEQPYATKEDLRLVEALFRHPDFCMEDEHGNPASPEQQELCKRLQAFIESRNWEPEIIEENGKLGLWNQFSECIMAAPKYESFNELPTQRPWEDIKEEKIIAQLNGKWGVISDDGNNRTIIPFSYDHISRYKYNGWFLIESEGKLGLSTAEGEILLPCCADKIWFDLGIGLNLYQQNYKIGLINPKTEAGFDKVCKEERSDYIIVRQAGRDYYLSASDGECIPVEFSGFIDVDRLKIYSK